MVAFAVLRANKAKRYIRLMLNELEARLDRLMRSAALAVQENQQPRHSIRLSINGGLSLRVARLIGICGGRATSTGLDAPWVGKTFPSA